MSNSDIEGLIPFLQQLLQRMRYQPPAAELVLLQKATFKEMRPFFDALAAGTNENEVYKMIISFLATGCKPSSSSSAPNSTSVKTTTTATADVRSKSPPREIPSAFNGASSKQVRKIMEDVELHITQSQQGGPNKLPSYALELSTKGTPNPVVLTVDFKDSNGIELIPDGPSKLLDPLTITVNVPTVANTGGKLLCASIATVLAKAGSHSLNYKVAIKGGASSSASVTTEASVKQQAGNSSVPAKQTNSSSVPAAQSSVVAGQEEDDDVTTVADGLSVVVRSVDAGYLLLASNSNSHLKYFMQIDLSESSNLKFIASGSAKLVDETKITVSLAPATGMTEIAKCNVKDFSLGSCDIRYKVLARIE